MFDLDRDTLVLGKNKTYVLTEMTGMTRTQIEERLNTIPRGDQGIQGATGATGATGPQGPVGMQGVAGPIGPEGPRGLQGLTGEAGLNGTDGVNGVDGAVGATGPVGPQGPQGLTGPQGVQGVAGLPGADGVNGADGAPGATGLQGPSGPQGPQGPAGAGLNIVGVIGTAGPPSSTSNAVNDVILDSNGIGWRWNGSTWNSVGAIQGPQGVQGIQGAQGDSGVQGIQGLTGPQGVAGPVGPQGIQGIAGPTGPQGAQGPAGVNGNDGADGADGADGVDGAVGPQGPQGNPGLQGATGPQGPAGQAGDIGLTGPAGPDGPQGIQGPIGLPGPAGPPGESSAGGGSISVNGSPPSAANVGDLWFNNDKGRLFVYVSDVDNSQWVESSPAAKGLDGRGYINGAYDPNTGKITLIGSGGNVNVVTADLRGRNGLNGVNGRDGIDGERFDGGTVDGLVEFNGPINMRNQMVFYGTRLIGTGDFDISGNSSIKLSAGGSLAAQIKPSEVVFEKQTQFKSLTTASNAANAYLTSSGVLKKSTSSARYKTCIESMTDEDALRFLDQARPVSYCPREAEECDSRLGFIAEEVAEVEPRYVEYDEIGRPDGVQYAAIVSSLTKICQLQEARIKALEEKLNGN